VRLADRRLLQATWDTDVPAGRPPRHLYRLTGSGRALATELAEVEVRSARWRLALSSVGAMLWLPPAGGWPVLALAAGVVVALVAAAGTGADRPGDRWRGRVHRRDRDLPAPGAGRGRVPAAGGGGPSRRRPGRLPVDRPGSPRWLGTNRLAPHLGAAWSPAPSSATGSSGRPHYRRHR
jgi:hypothetical protein